MSKSGTARSLDRSIPRFQRNCYTDFHGSCTTLRFPQHRMSFPLLHIPAHMWPRWVCIWGLLNFVQSDEYGSVWVLLHATIQFYQRLLLKMLSIFQCVFLTSLFKKTMWHGCVGLYLGLPFNPFLNIPVFVSIPCLFIAVALK